MKPFLAFLILFLVILAVPSGLYYRRKADDQAARDMAAKVVKVHVGNDYGSYDVRADPQIERVVLSGSGRTREAVVTARYTSSIGAVLVQAFRVNLTRFEDRWHAVDVAPVPYTFHEETPAPTGPTIRIEPPTQAGPPGPPGSGNPFGS